MIQINLIPDVKRELIHAQHMRYTAITISILTAAAAVGIVVLLGIGLGAQKLHESYARSQITSKLKKLQAVENIEYALTIQNQLSKLGEVHTNKSMNSRLFDLMRVVNPADPNSVKISTLTLDPSAKTIRIEGSAANGYPAVETFRKTILNTSIEQTLADDKGKTTTTTVPLTSDVQLGETSYGEAADGSRVLRYVLSFKYPEELFTNKAKSLQIKTQTGKVDVTDSKLGVPESLFSQKATDIKEEKK